MSPQAEAEAAGLYLHVPFCSAICPYCDFAVRRHSDRERRLFVDQLLAEADLWTEADLAQAEHEATHAGRAWYFDTLYLGGGTPSLLRSEELHRLILGLRERFQFSPDLRLFLEANPEDLNKDNLLAWRQLGVETLSLGVQSFEDETLSFLGRRHSGRDAVRATQMALEAGFATVSIDLIYGLPQRDEASWQRDLESVVRLGPSHLSCYQLEVHPQTVFGKLKERGKLRELPDDEQAQRFRLTHQFLADSGFEPYEVSSFARAPEHRSRHNRKYWHHVPYLGLGPSACSYRNGRRWWNERSLPAWLRRLEQGERPLAGEEVLSIEDMALERLMTGLRTTEGVDLEPLSRSLGLDLYSNNQARIESWRAEGLVQLHGHRLQPTLPGLAVADGMAASLSLTAVQ